MSSHRRESASGDDVVDDFTSVLNSCIVEAPTVNDPQPNQPTFSDDSMEEFDRACDVFGGWTDYVYGPGEENDNSRLEQAVAPSTSLPFATHPAMSAPPAEVPMTMLGGSSDIQQRHPIVASGTTGEEVYSFSPQAFSRPRNEGRLHRTSPLSTVTSAYPSSPAGHQWPQDQPNFQPQRRFATGIHPVDRDVANDVRPNQQPTGVLTTRAYPGGSLQAGLGIVPHIHSAQPPAGPTDSVAYYIPTWQASQEVVTTRTIIQREHTQARTVAASEPIFSYPSQALFTVEHTNRIQAGANTAYTLARSQSQRGRRLPVLAPNPNPRTAPMPLRSSDSDFHLPLDQRRVPDFVELLQADLIQFHQLRRPQYNWIDPILPQFREEAIVNVRRAWLTLAQVGTSRAERASQHEYLHRLTTFIRQLEQHRERQPWLRQQLPRIWNLVRQHATAQQGSQEWVAVDTEITQLRETLTELERNTVRQYIREQAQELHEQQQRHQRHQAQQ